MRMGTSFLLFARTGLFSHTPQFQHRDPPHNLVIDRIVCLTSSELPCAMVQIHKLILFLCLGSNSNMIFSLRFFSTLRIIVHVEYQVLKCKCL